MAGKVVACLDVIVAGRDPDDTPSDIEIRGSEQFYLGRNESICRQSWPDLVISNKHLRIHSVLYDQDSVTEIPPFVYATDLSTNGTYLKKANSECASSQGRGIRMGRNDTFLLDDGDELRLSDSVTLVYRSVARVRDAKLSAIQEQEKQLFSSRYLITGRVLGAGAFGKVLVAYRQRTQRQLACKIIDLRKHWSNHSPSDLRSTNGNHGLTHRNNTYEAKKRWPSRIAKLFREFDILKDLSHPNIIAIEKVFWSSNTFYIFQELVTGGDLFSYIEYKGGRLSEVETAVVIRQILVGVEYLHNRNIVHRDLKPDNILMTSLDDGARVIITDFGGARYIPKGGKTQRMFSQTGTPEYAAPELLALCNTDGPRRGYSASVDMWSIGVITGISLSGEAMFFDVHCIRSEYELDAVRARALKCDLSSLDDKSHRVWRTIGHRPKDFIRNLLVLREGLRMTATEALAHPWFTNECHVAAFDDLYDRAIRDWLPRHKSSRLVESIPQMTSELPLPPLSDRFLSQEVISRHFAPPRRISSIEQEVRLDASPARPPSQDEEHEYGSAQRAHNSQISQRYNGNLGNENLLHSSMEQPSVDAAHEEGRYTAYDQKGSAYDYTNSQPGDEDMTAGMDSIYPFSIPAPPPETPGVEEPDSWSKVPETPLKRGIKRPREECAQVPDMARDSDETEDESDGVNGNSTTHIAPISKRGKLHHR